MIIWSESLDRIIPLCQEFEEKLIKLLWRSRPLLNTSSASSIQYHGGVGGESSGNGSLLGCPGSGSVEGANGNGNNNNGNAALGRANGSSSLTLNLLHSSNITSPSVLKGPYGEQGRVFDEFEMHEKDKDKDVSRFSGHLNGHNHDQQSEDRRNNKTRGGHQRTWHGMKLFVPPSSKQGDDLERCGGERRPIRLYAPVYNGLAAGIALGVILCFVSFGEGTLTPLLVHSVRR